MKKLPEYFFLFIIITFVLLGSGIKGYASESDIAFNDYKMEETPREGDTARKIVITTDWKGAMPVRNGYRTHEITVSPITIIQGEILSLELICAQQEKGSSYANTCGNSIRPTWKINTELNSDPIYYPCDLFITGPDFRRYLPWGQSPREECRVVYAAIFLFRSIGKAGHFELEYTVPNLWIDYWKTTVGKLVIRVPVEIVSASAEATAQAPEQATDQ